MTVDNETILIFYGNKFDTPLLTEQYFLRYLSAQKKVICFEYPQFSNLFNILLKKIKLISRPNDNLIIYHSFGIIPFGRTFRLANFINHNLNFLVLKLILDIYTINLKIITYTPELVYLLKYDEINNSKIIYYVVDRYLSFPVWKNIFQKNQFKFLEDKLLKICSTVICNSEATYNLYKRRHVHLKLFNQPSGINFNSQKLIKNRYIPVDIIGISRPIAGCIGSLYDWKLDINLLKVLLFTFPKISFILIGDLKISRKLLYTLESYKNFFYLGYKNIDDIPYYIKSFDICIIPYSLNKARYAFPTKIYEYLFSGKPVVTTSLSSIRNMNKNRLIYWSKNYKEFIYNVQKAVKEKTKLSTINKRRHFALINSWPERLNDFIKIIS